MTQEGLNRYPSSWKDFPYVNKINVALKSKKHSLKV